MCLRLFAVIPLLITLTSLGFGQPDIGIKLCRMRNCTIVEDLRGITEARAGGNFVSVVSGSGVAFNSIYSHARQQIYGMPRPFGYDFSNYGLVPSSKARLHDSSSRTTTIILTNKQDTKDKQDKQNSIFQEDTKKETVVNAPPLAFPPPPLNPSPPPPLPPLAPPEFKKVAQDSGTEPSESQCAASVVARVSATTQLSILAEGLAATGLDSFLADQSFQGTILAPTNDAWERLAQGSGQSLDKIFSEVETLRSILGLHILAGQTRFLQDFQNGQVLDTIVEGEQLKVEVKDESVRIIPSQEISAANILVPDVPACGAVIHVIDGVLLANAEQSSNCMGCRKLSQISLYQELVFSIQDEEMCKMEEYEPCCEEYYVKDYDQDICSIADSFGIQCHVLKQINDLQQVVVGDVIQIC